eukprot:11193148-Lingulodinium_polyedra.AAC.1
MRERWGLRKRTCWACGCRGALLGASRRFFDRPPRISCILEFFPPRPGRQNAGAAATPRKGSAPRARAGEGAR